MVYRRQQFTAPYLSPAFSRKAVDFIYVYDMAIAFSYHERSLTPHADRMIYTTPHRRMLCLHAPPDAHAMKCFLVTKDGISVRLYNGRRHGLMPTRQDYYFVSSSAMRL